MASLPQDLSAVFTCMYHHFPSIVTPFVDAPMYPSTFALVLQVLVKVPVTGHQRIQQLAVHTRVGESFQTK